MTANPRYNKYVAITKSDTADFADPPAPQKCCDAIYVGGAGVVVVVDEGGNTASFTAVAGGYLYTRARRVNSTNTTASLLVALYEGP